MPQMFSAKIEETKQKSKDSHTRTFNPSEHVGGYWGLNSSRATYASKLMEFVRPVDDTERTIAEITVQMKGASGVLFSIRPTRHRSSQLNE